MRPIFALLALSPLFACSAPPIGFQGGFSAVELSPSVRKPAKPIPRPDGSSSESLLEVASATLVAGLLADGPGPALPLAYDEFRMALSRERSDGSGGEAYGLGAELSRKVTPELFTRLGFWVLESEDFGSSSNAEVGRLSLGLGHIVPLAGSTHFVASLGFEWARDRKSSVNFFSLSHDGGKGLFGSDHSVFGFDADIALRHRMNSWLELTGGIRGETLRDDSVGGFGIVRFFVSSNVALYFEYEDVDEPTAKLGLAIIGG